MIRAAVRYANGEGVPPPELSRFLRWRTWGILPRAGGTDDQRAGELDRMLACANSYDIWRMHTHDRKLDKMNTDQLKMLEALTELMQDG